MFASLRSVAFAGLSIMWCGVSASAETLRCQSVNGNLNCAGSSGASCQTIDGKTVCVSRHGDIVQSFGRSSSPDTSGEFAKDSEVSPSRMIKQQLEQYRNHRQQLLDQEETHLGND
jgi:hypothetical protein